MSDAAQQRRFLIRIDPFKEWMKQVMLARGFDEPEASMTAEFSAIAALYEVETHGDRKLLHLLDDEQSTWQASNRATRIDVSPRRCMLSGASICLGPSAGGDG